MEVIKNHAPGYCYGVVDAIRWQNRSLKVPLPPAYPYPGIDRSQRVEEPGKGVRHHLALTVPAGSNYRRDRHLYRPRAPPAAQAKAREGPRLH